MHSIVIFISQKRHKNNGHYLFSTLNSSPKCLQVLYFKNKDLVS